jgi:hypothetical protein
MPAAVRYDAFKITVNGKLPDHSGQRYKLHYRNYTIQLAFIQRIPFYQINTDISAQ